MIRHLRGLLCPNIFCLFPTHDFSILRKFYRLQCSPVVQEDNEVQLSGGGLLEVGYGQELGCFCPPRKDQINRLPFSPWKQKTGQREKKCNSKAIKNSPGKKLSAIANICALAAFSHTQRRRHVWNIHCKKCLPLLELLLPLKSALCIIDVI